MDIPLCGTSLTGHIIEELIKKYGKLDLDGHKLEDIQAMVGAENEGFTSKFIRAHLKWSPGANLPNAIVMKVMESSSLAEVFNSTREASAEVVEGNMQSHDTECSVYGFPGLANVVPIPKCFAAEKLDRDHPVLILEDLGPFAITLPLRTFGLGLNEMQLEQVLDAVTSVHAWSLNTDVDWKGSIPIARDCHATMIEFFTKYYRDFYDESAKVYPEIFNKLDRTKFDELLTMENYHQIFCSDPMAKYGLPLVMVHGDIHGTNMMFERKNGDEAGDKLAALIDWQVTHQGCAMEDLAAIVVMCMSKEMVKEKKEVVLHRYTELFNLKVKNPRDRIDIKNVKKAFNIMYSFVAVQYLACLSVKDSFMDKMKNATEEERKITKDRLTELFLSLFEDAVKILEW